MATPQGSATSVLSLLASNPLPWGESTRCAALSFGYGTARVRRISRSFGNADSA
jgi:hypothetical protein